MAINENGYIRGQIGNIVNRKVGNKNIMQTKPSRKTRQTEKTKAAACDFGTASAASSLIQRAFAPTYQELHDGGMHNRLVKQIQRVLRGAGKAGVGFHHMRDGHIERLVNFQFNDNCHMYDYLYFDPKITIDDSRTVHIRLPVFERHNNLFLPAKATNIYLGFDVVGFKFFGKTFTPIGFEGIDLKLYDRERKKEEPRHFTFLSDDKNYDVIIVTLAINYLSVQKERTYTLNTKELNPVAILAAFTC